MQGDLFVPGLIAHKISGIVQTIEVGDLDDSPKIMVSEILKIVFLIGDEDSQPVELFFSAALSVHIRTMIQ
jgi:hypothetical protein